MQPKQPEHADYETAIAGTDARFTLRRLLVGYAYPVNGNVHNPTPRYLWQLRVDGQPADAALLKRTMVSAARDNGAAYLSEFDARKVSNGD